MSVNAKNEGSMGEVQTASSFTAEAPADFRTQLQLRKKGGRIGVPSSHPSQNPARAGGDPVLLPHPSFGLSVFFLFPIPPLRLALCVFFFFSPENIGLLLMALFLVSFP